MSWKPTILVLLLATLGVVGAVRVWQRDLEGDGKTAGPTVVLSREQLPIDQVTSITLRRGDEPTLVFERSDRGWQQIEPFAHPLDMFSIRQLLVQAAHIEVTRQLDPRELQGGRSEEALGLDPPRAELRFQWPDGAVTLQFGRRGVAGRWYVRIRGYERVFVASGDLHDRAVEMDPKEWRDRTIFIGADVDADRIIMQQGAVRTVLKHERKQWLMMEPVQTRVSDLARDEFFAALGRARSGGFILDQPDDLAKFGLAGPIASMEVIATRVESQADELVRVETTQRLLVGARLGIGSDDRFGLIEGRPVVVRLPVAVLRAFFRTPESLIALTASGVVPADVKSLVIRAEQGELRMERDLDRWRAPDFFTEVPPGTVNELLEQLTSLQAAQIRIMEYPQDLQVATITMRGFDNRPIDTVRIARERDTGRWLLENGDNVLRVFAESLQLRLTPADFGLQSSPPDTR
ncbi:MAG: DUF4340 domain-containing protein [Phycisphaerales bacterium]